MALLPQLAFQYMTPSPILPWQATHNPEYRIARGWRIFACILVPPLVLMFLAIPLLMMSGQNPSIGLAAGFAIISLGAIWFMIYTLLATLKGRFIIGTQEVSQVGAFKTKTLALNEILGYRVDTQHIYIYPKESYLPTIKIGYITERHQEIGLWLAGHYPDLDHLETEQATAALLADDTIGDTPAARATAVAKARQTALVLNSIGGAVGAWLLLYPHPYKWVIPLGILWPWLAVAALWQLPRTLRIDEKKKSGYPSVLIAFIAPSFGLLLRALFDYKLVSYAPLWPLAGAVVAGVAIVLALVSRNFLFRQGSTGSVGLTIVLLAALYGYAATSIVNAVYDESQATVFKPQVTGKHITSGKSTTYYLTLQPWGPVQAAEDVNVSSDYYEQVQEGQSVTVVLRPGWLGVPWFNVVEE